MRVRKIKIKSVREGLEEFAKDFRSAEAGKLRKSKFEVFFVSMEAVKAILTTERINLLRAIKTVKPGSIYALAKATGRNLKNVSQDVKYLSELGLIDLKKCGDPRRSKKPVLLADRIQVEITI